MKLCKVTFLPETRSVSVHTGSTLLKAASMAGVHINASCGGAGTCGKCRAVVQGDNFRTEPSIHLTPSEMKKGYVLSCLTVVQGDLTVEIPREAQKGVGVRIDTGRRPGGELLKIGDRKIRPRTKKLHLKITPPTLNDNISDLDRLFRELKKAGYKDLDITCGLPVLQKLGRTLRESHWDVTVTLFWNRCEIEIMDIEPGDVTLSRYGLAVDVGTTTVVAYLVHLNTGKIVDVESDLNAQIRCGEDVISRIVYATEIGTVEEVHNLVIETINGLVEKLAAKNGILPESIDSVVSAGNTTMTHLLYGIDPRYIREEPYIPTVNLFPVIKAREIGIRVNQNASIYSVPGTASYVGGDISAGILASGVYKSDALTIFIDIGTNGEIVLGNKDWMVAASCSAGPAFEGGGVKFGMRASRGAIEGVRIDRKTLEPTCHVIGDAEPQGICGSGMIDALAEMYLAGVINQKGKFVQGLKTDRIREGETGLEYVMVRRDEDKGEPDIVLASADIDNIIRTKGAIYAGFKTLINEMNLTFQDVERFVIAGGFGNYIEIEKAIIIGLLPDLPEERFHFIGNSSIIGSYLVLLSKELRLEAEEIARKMTYIELSVSHSFMDEYMSALFLPHTNMDDFPSVKEIIRKRKISG
ncbi:MAG: ASKHA domain-containing protein [bacterium]